ncbi:type I glutamate--ammonia ligase [Alicyclobacillus acidocaldarius]|uniref:Glutamine synthetase n=1 Tax=Alicyclobacillus acidocaldarius (strain Tc-4-1) TaxID=1048834 RepID=F8IJD6_ALIAT|nr:type I glutamate--ammonia ligase [Alicyclobacillus acidocaldarius]AEJ43456.1 glutamine synthetase, type I [Alicyclobacillus acidocaldarius subsp. acidocaldarius Tc-4-1]
MTPRDILELMKQHEVQMVDFRIVDVPGRQHHVTVPAAEIDEEVLERGVAFDGSSVPGFRGIEESDMVMRPVLETAFLDPFTEVPTLAVTCNVYEPSGNRYERDPRYIAEKAEQYLKSTGIATTAYFGPELEFFIFDDVRFDSTQSGAFYAIDSEEAVWNTGTGAKNLGYHVKNKSGYFPVAPTDTQQDIRTEMVLELMKAGIRVERHHHEVATAGQAEINFRFGTLTRTADTVMTYKYIVRNVARRHGKTATFMPKPIFGDNGSGMHVHQSLFNGDEPLFYREGGYANLSDIALQYIAGILYHAPAILAFSNPSTNSYKRLVPGYEAPVNLVFSRGNRSAAIRVPVAVVSPKTARIEFRTPDCTANPYLAFAAMLMAGLDGIRRKLDPTELGFGPINKNIYELSAEEKAQIKSVPGSLGEVLDALEADHEFLLEGGVFTKDFIRNWIDFKRNNELAPLHLRPHPYEFSLYFDL